MNERSKLEMSGWRLLSMMTHTVDSLRRDAERLERECNALHKLLDPPVELTRDKDQQ